MTTKAKDVLIALGLAQDDTPRRIARATHDIRKTGERAMAAVHPAYLWIGAGLAAAGTAAWVMRNGGRRARRVGDVMVRDVITVDATATLNEAARLMRDHNIGVLPVVEQGQLRGILTDRDLVVRAMARNLDGAATPVHYVASEEPACARPDWDVEDAMSVMSDNQIGRLPVVDGDNRVIGMVTLSSLALRSREKREALTTAQSVSRRSARAS